MGKEALLSRGPRRQSGADYLPSQLAGGQQSWRGSGDAQQPREVGARGHQPTPLLPPCPPFLSQAKFSHSLH